MAERFTEEVQLQQVSTRTGAAQGLLSLADKLESFKQTETQLIQVGAKRIGERAAKRGAETAAEVKLGKKDGITQAPEFKEEPFFFGRIEAQAHNKALRAAYVASLDNDNREAIARITAENPDDLIAFNEAVQGYRNGVLKGVDSSVRALVQQDLDSKITTVRNKVQINEIEKQKTFATAQTELAAQSALDEAIVSAQQGDLGKSAESLQSLFLIYEGQVESGIISTAEAQIKRRDAELQATSATVVGGIKDMVGRGDFNNAIESIIKFREKIPKGFTADEHKAVVSAMTSEVNESIALNNKLEDTESQLVKDSQASKYVELFSGIASGTATMQGVLTALNSKQITPEQASKLTNTLNTRGRGVDEWSLVTRIQDGIREGLNMRGDIIANAGTNLTESTAASLLADNDQAEDRESPLQTNTAKRAEGFITQSLRVTGLFGALDTEAERKLANARRAYAERVLAGEDPWFVADTLVGKDDFDRAANPKFGNKQNLEQSLELLKNARITKQIDGDTYNSEFNKLKNLIQLRDNIIAFDKARKEVESVSR